MENTVICVLKHMSVYTVVEGQITKFEIDFEGIEKGEGIIHGPADEPTRRYFCNNCKQYFDGEESFSMAKSHLGKFHESPHPFSD